MTNHEQTPAVHLLPCPFCGCQEACEIVQDADTRWYECSFCQSAGPVEDSEDRPPRGWNHRVDLIKPQAVAPLREETEAEHIARDIREGRFPDQSPRQTVEVAPAPVQDEAVQRPSQAALDVLAERKRQIEVEGWTPEHDDAYQGGAMADAAACYALNAPQIDPDRVVPYDWPWRAKWWKPTDRRRDLVKAGALILAEIERIDRAAMEGR